MDGGLAVNQKHWAAITSARLSPAWLSHPSHPTQTALDSYRLPTCSDTCRCLVSLSAPRVDRNLGHPWLAGEARVEVLGTQSLLFLLATSSQPSREVPLENRAILELI